MARLSPIDSSLASRVHSFPAQVAFVVRDVLLALLLVSLVGGVSGGLPGGWELLIFLVAALAVIRVRAARRRPGRP